MNVSAFIMLELFAYLLIIGIVSGEVSENLRQLPGHAPPYAGGHIALTSAHQSPVDAYRTISTAQVFKPAYQNIQAQVSKPGYQNIQYKPQHTQSISQHQISGHRDVIPIVKEANQPNYGDGSYSFSYEGGNGITASEYGVHNAGQTSEDGVQAAAGSYSYTGPDNVVYSISYTAGVEGFVPVGAHIPTPPPIPDAIQKGLTYHLPEELNKNVRFSNEIDNQNRYNTAAYNNVYSTKQNSLVGKFLSPPSEGLDYTKSQEQNDNYTR